MPPRGKPISRIRYAQNPTYTPNTDVTCCVHQKLGMIPCTLQQQLVRLGRITQNANEDWIRQVTWYEEALNPTLMARDSAR